MQSAWRGITDKILSHVEINGAGPDSRQTSRYVAQEYPIAGAFSVAEPGKLPQKLSFIDIC